MFVDKALTLKTLLESQDGVHLTGYLVNRNDPTDRKAQLLSIINDAYDLLGPVMPAEERRKFLEPLNQILHGPHLLNKMRGNIGLFRTRESFRMLSLPVELETQCIVATSFHVKPLLRWIQTDQAFLLLGLDRVAAHLYLGSQYSLAKLGALPYPAGAAFAESGLAELPNLRKLKNKRLSEAFRPTREWIADLTATERPRLFVAGEKALTDAFLAGLTYRPAVREPLAGAFREREVESLVQLIRAKRVREVTLKLEQAILEFFLAEDQNLSRKNIFQIAKAAIQGRVRKLIVADGINIFGKLNRQTGGVAIHPFALDHEDDDLLDDLAQTVLAQGGEVIVAHRDKIPNGRPILAILDQPERERRPRLENLGKLSEETRATI